MVDRVLVALSPTFDAIYAESGSPAIPRSGFSARYSS
jgi:hypothetical protein